MAWYACAPNCNVRIVRPLREGEPEVGYYDPNDPDRGFVAEGVAYLFAKPETTLPEGANPERFFHDLLAVYTERQVNAPTGSWEVHLAPRRIGGKSWRDLINAMDYVEIRMSPAYTRPGSLYSDKNPVPVMRGFVDNIQETVDAAGNWKVVINGRDYGKLLLQTQVWYRAQKIIDESVGTDAEAAKLLQRIGGLNFNFGIGVGTLTPTQFVLEIANQLIRPNIQFLRRYCSQIRQFDLSVTVPDGYGVNGFGIQPFTGPVWNLLNQYAGRPFVETFFVDHDYAPVLYYRFPPYKRYDGTRINDGVLGHLHEPELRSSDLLSYSLGSSDNEVYTYYFTYPVFSILERVQFKGLASDKRNPKLESTPYLRRYGFRPLEIATTLIPTSQSADQTKANSDFIKLAGDLNELLYEQNRDNHLFNNGVVTVRGDGDIVCGSYLKVLREPGFSGRSFEGYVTSVRQEFNVISGTFKTTAGLSRIRPIEGAAS